MNTKLQEGKSNSERFAYLAFAKKYIKRLDKLTEIHILPAIRFSINIAYTLSVILNSHETGESESSKLKEKIRKREK